MRMTILAFTAATLMASGLQAKSRDPGPPDKRQAAVDSFDRIAVAGPYMVKVSTGKEPGISLAGPRTMLDDTELLVRDGQLIIRWQEGASWSRNGSHGVDIDIKVPILREATMAGAGSLEIDRVQSESFVAMLVSSGGIDIQELDAKQFKARLVGSGSLAIGKLDAEAVDVTLTGSGGMRAAGRAGTATLRLDSSSSFNGPGLTVDDANIVLAGSGAVRATVTKSADIKTMGSGDVELTGGAKCSVSKMGSGNVRCS